MKDSENKMLCVGKAKNPKNIKELRLLYYHTIENLMNFEFEEFDSPEEIFLYMSTIAPPMKNTMPINSYKGYTFALIPLNPTAGDLYLVVYTKGKLDGKLLEFDMNLRKYRSVEAAERTDKIYFVVLTPKRNTIADAAIKEIVKNST